MDNNWNLDSRFCSIRWKWYGEVIAKEKAIKSSPKLIWPTECDRISKEKPLIQSH
jgi:hypothetical protein